MNGLYALLKVAHEPLFSFQAIGFSISDSFIGNAKLLFKIESNLIQCWYPICLLLIKLLLCLCNKISHHAEITLNLLLAHRLDHVLFADTFLHDLSLVLSMLVHLLDCVRLVLMELLLQAMYQLILLGQIHVSFLSSLQELSFQELDFLVQLIVIKHQLAALAAILHILSFLCQLRVW